MQTLLRTWSGDIVPGNKYCTKLQNLLVFQITSLNPYNESRVYHESKSLASGANLLVLGCLHNILPKVGYFRLSLTLWSMKQVPTKLQKNGLSCFSGKCEMFWMYF